MDTYQLKSLDGVVEGSFQGIRFEKDKGKIHVRMRDGVQMDNFALRQSYDTLIRCLGFTFDDSLFNV